MKDGASLVGSDGKESACNSGDQGSIPGVERHPGEGNSYSLQYSCLENSMDREAWWVQSRGLLKVGPDWVTSPFTSLNGREFGVRDGWRCSYPLGGY